MTAQEHLKKIMDDHRQRLVADIQVQEREPSDKMMRDFWDVNMKPEPVRSLGDVIRSIISRVSQVVRRRSAKP